MRDPEFRSSRHFLTNTLILHVKLFRMQSPIEEEIEKKLKIKITRNYSVPTIRLLLHDRLCFPKGKKKWASRKMDDNFGLLGRNRWSALSMTRRNYFHPPWNLLASLAVLPTRLKGTLIDHVVILPYTLYLRMATRMAK